MREPGCQKRKRKAIERRQHVANLAARRANPTAYAFRQLGISSAKAVRNIRRITNQLNEVFHA